MTPRLAIALLALLPLWQTPSPDSLMEDVRAITLATPHDERFEAVASLLRTRNIPFAVETFPIREASAPSRTQGRNIIVSLGEGSGDLLLGAHFDTVGLGGGLLSRGAIDNAASSAILVSVAQTLRAQSPQPRVRIVWFDAEELHLLGSRHFVESHKQDLPAAMLNFDVNAYGDTVLFGAPPRQVSAVPPGALPAGATIKQMPVTTADVVRSAALATLLLHACADEEIDCLRSGLPESDYLSFGSAGVPALLLTTLPGVEAHKMWLVAQAGMEGSGLKDPFPAVLRMIHSPADVMAKVEGPALARMHRLVVTAVRRWTAARDGR